MNSGKSTATLDKIVALCKRRGFVYQSADIYGGLNGLYDFGHLGTLFKQNIRKAWLASMYEVSANLILLEGTILAPRQVWEASGHIQNFHDPMVDCLECKHRYRADELDLQKACPHCGKKNWTEIRQFNMMFKTHAGATATQGAEAYLRPETAQAIYINFKNVIATNRIKIPFGITQIGKAFRNEITPKQFLFRMREFEQMEMEWFCKPETAMAFFELWSTKRLAFYSTIGLNPEHMRMRIHQKDELAHYSQCTSDIEYLFPFGWKELEGVAYRGDFDLKQHSTHSGKDLTVFDEETKTSYTPHVVETSVGVDRLFLTLLFDAYREETIEDQIRIVLALHPRLAPIKAAFMPLTKAQLEPLQKIYNAIKKTLPECHFDFDESGSIGKRYRRQDEIGTPLCFTYDFDSLATNTVTIRYRDSMKQERISIDTIAQHIITILS